MMPPRRHAEKLFVDISFAFRAAFSPMLLHEWPMIFADIIYFQRRRDFRRRRHLRQPISFATRAFAAD